LYVRHQAWLNATPKEQEKPRREMYTEGSPYLEMAPLSSYQQWILELWHKAGTIAQGAGGLLPLEWPSLIQWANKFYSETYIEWVEHPKQNKRHKTQYSPITLSQCTLLDSELELIRQLSVEYSSEYAAANEPTRMCPKTVYEDEVCEEDVLKNAEAIEKAMMEMFGDNK